MKIVQNGLKDESSVRTTQGGGFLSRYVFQKGFSLIEVALVLVIIGLLTAGGLNLVKSKREQAMYGASVDALKKSKEALVAYVVINGHLPCPDSDLIPDGSENRGTNQCSANTGVLPYIDMGLNQVSVKDSWGNYIRYEINTGATVLANVNVNTHSASFFNLSSAIGAGSLSFSITTPTTALNPGVGNLDVNDGAGSPWAANQIALLIAQNSNGKQAIASCGSLGAKEQENCDGDTDFIQDFRLIDVSGQFFDDKLLGISAGEIKTAIIKEHPDIL